MVETDGWRKMAEDRRALEDGGISVGLETSAMQTDTVGVASSRSVG